MEVFAPAPPPLPTAEPTATPSPSPTPTQAPGTTANYPTPTPTAPPTSPPMPTLSPTPPPVPTVQYHLYTVQLNDTLFSINRYFFGSIDRMNEIMELNNMTDPNRVVAGIEIRIPY